MNVPVAERSKTVLTNVRVFDGRELGAPTTMVIDGSVIGTDAVGAQVVNVGGAVLLPGLIDTHVHLDGPKTVDLMASYGVTTALDMATFPAVMSSLRHLADGTRFRTAGTPIIGPGGAHSHLPGLVEIAGIADPSEAEAMVAERVAAGSDYLKLALEEPGQGGPDAETANAVVSAAHSRGLLVVAHVGGPGSYVMALDAGVDVMTHAPLTMTMPHSAVERMVSGRHVCVPTLAMLQGCAGAFGHDALFANSLASVGAMHAAGVPILAGTDANSIPGLPFHPAHGASLHDELELLVEAGLSTIDALNAATALPAQHFGLSDRGVIEPGRRADLVLLEGDPIADIRATRSIARIWCGGVEYATAGDLRVTS